MSLVSSEWYKNVGGGGKSGKTDKKMTYSHYLLAVWSDSLSWTAQQRIDNEELGTVLKTQVLCIC